MSIHSIDRTAVWLDPASADIAQLVSQCERITAQADVPLAVDVVQQIPVYDGELVRAAARVQDGSGQRVRALQQEWARVLLKGAGVILVRNAYEDLNVIDDVTGLFNKIIAREKASDSGADHFAPAGSNTRIWNAHEKLCVQSPELFLRYYANDVMALVCRAWLGPGYQITAQANIVHPGGRAQHCHRDYHMGFQQAEQLYQYPAHVHAMSPMLTLQGAIAHSDMPVQSGPTKLLPFSQNFVPGFLATARTDCVELFEARHVQLPLSKGDMMFFSPALMHAAGDNHTSDHQRFANLVQVGSIYGRTMELLDTGRMCVALYPALQARMQQPDWQTRFTEQLIEACAESYPFPANMELEPPVNGLAPVSQHQLMSQCLSDGCSVEDFAQKITAQKELKRSH